MPDDPFYRVVMTTAAHTYFDHPAEASTNEIGFYWASRFTDLMKVFSFRSGHPDFFLSVFNDYLKFFSPLSPDKGRLISTRMPITPKMAKNTNSPMFALLLQIVQH